MPNLSARFEINVDCANTDQTQSFFAANRHTENERVLIAMFRSNKPDGTPDGTLWNEPKVVWKINPASPPHQTFRVMISLVRKLCPIVTSTNVGSLNEVATDIHFPIAFAMETHLLDAVP